MNEEIQQRITKYLDAIESQASSAGDFVVEQTPLLAQEYLAWEFWSSVINSVALLPVGVALAICCILGFRAFWKCENREQHPEVVILIVPLLLSFACFLQSVDLGRRAVKVSVAPRVVLLEKVSELVK